MRHCRDLTGKLRRHGHRWSKDICTTCICKVCVLFHLYMQDKYSVLTVFSLGRNMNVKGVLFRLYPWWLHSVRSNLSRAWKAFIVQLMPFSSLRRHGKFVHFSSCKINERLSTWIFSRVYSLATICHPSMQSRKNSKCSSNPHLPCLQDSFAVISHAGLAIAKVFHCCIPISVEWLHKFWLSCKPVTVN